MYACPCHAMPLPVSAHAIAYLIHFLPGLHHHQWYDLQHAHEQPQRITELALRHQLVSALQLLLKL